MVLSTISVKRRAPHPPSTWDEKRQGLEATLDPVELKLMQDILWAPFANGTPGTLPVAAAALTEEKRCGGDDYF